MSTNFFSCVERYDCFEPQAVTDVEGDVGFRHVIRPEDDFSRDLYVHADFGGPLNFPGIDPGIFAYRLNLVDQGGGTQIHNQTIGRSLESLALDVHLPDNLLVQFNASHSHYNTWGVTPAFDGSGSNSLYLHPTDPSQIYANPHAKFATEDDLAGIKITWKPDDVFTIRSEYHYDRSYSSNVGQLSDTFSLVSPDGTMTNYILGVNETGYTYYTHAGYSYLDTDFDIFGTHHRVTTGFNGYWKENNQSGTSLNTAIASSTSPCNFYQQSSCTSPYPTSLSYAYGTGYVTGAGYEKNYMIGDEMKAFGDKLIILAGANYASIGSMGFHSDGTQSGTRTDAAALTPTVGVTYKILPWLSAYGLFQQSLTSGGFAPTTYMNAPVTNGNALIPPYIGTQWEAGFKATVGANMLATIDIYDIRKAATFIQNNNNGTYTEIIGGSQHDTGLEFKLTGKLWEDLTLVGGASFMNPRLVAVPTALYTQNQLVPGVSPINGSLYAEYSIPFFEQAPWLHGLILTGGVRYQGPFKETQPGSFGSLATYSLVSSQGYAVADLGFRYLTQVEGHPVTFRFTASNVTNYGYWSGEAIEGTPRTYAATMDVKW